jgi:hypothetical protein
MIKLKRMMLMIMVILLSFFAKAQETTSEIQGMISNSNQEPLPFVTVVATHMPTGTKYGTTTREDGRYNLPNLKIGGPYSIEVSFVGLENKRQDDIMLFLGQTFKANFVLKEASTQVDEVIVLGEQNKTFNSSRTGSQETVGRAGIEVFPTVSRSWKDIIKLVPSQNNLSFGGMSSQLNNVTVDGANFNNSFGLGDGTLGGQTGAQPISLDAVEQIQVNLTPFDVKYGGFNGASINTVTRSGKNEFFGSVYHYLKGQDLQGYKVGDVTMPTQEFDYGLNGFTVGGAIIKNKLFFFLNAEQEKRTAPGTQWVASDANNPPNGTNISNANAAQLDELSKFLVDNYGYNPGPYQGYTYKSLSKRITAKIDWNINEKNTFTLKYNMLRSSNQIPPSNSGSANSSYGRSAGQYAMPFYGAGYEINNNADIFIAELNTRFSNTSNNKIQVGYTKLNDFRNALTSADFPLVDILDGNGQPFTSFGYEQYTYNNLLNTNVFQFNDIFTMYIGSHEITLGTQNSYKTYENGFSPSYQGVYRFNSLADFYASAAPGSTKPAARYDLSYALGDGSFPLVGPKDLELGLFGQDKWRIRDNFTLTYGIRIDYTKFYNTFLENPAVANLTGFYNGIRVNTGKAPKPALQVSPRVGFNWDVFSDQSLQIRGGAGLFQGAPPFVWISNQASNSGMALFGSISNDKTKVFSPDVNAYRPTVQPGASKSYSINVTDPDYKFPQVFKSTLAVDKKLFGFTVTAEGTFIQNINASVFQNIALPSTGLITLSDGRTRFPVTSVYPVGGAAAATVENPSIGNAIYMTNANAGYSAYGTLQIQRQFKDLFVSAAYTRQVAKDATVNGSTASTMWGSRPNTGNSNDFETGYSNNYMPNRVIGSLVYKKSYAKVLASSIGLIYEGMTNSSSSLSYIYNGDLNGDGFSNDLMYIPKDASDPTFKLTNAAKVSGVEDTRTQEELWSQLNTFIDENPYLSKNRGKFAERQALILPWINRIDLNFTQDVYIKVKSTKHTLRFTADIYNFTNLLNKNWGTYQLPTTVSPLTFVKLDADGKTPIYSFPYSDGKNKVPYTKAFRDDVGFNSRYQIQFGIRYIFN